MAETPTKKSSIQAAPTRALKDVDIASKVLEFIPEDAASYYKVVPLGVVDGVLEVGAINPNDLEARDALNFISAKIGMPYKLFQITENDLKFVP
ncbi:hypothetical protein KW807_02305, partial [Candidatus Parcubacteria bacterium]|nr:hypothetical protein [Candidatus Parcubacteria bacterium]